jgi:hypothetical protein
MLGKSIICVSGAVVQLTSLGQNKLRKVLMARLIAAVPIMMYQLAGTQPDPKCDTPQPRGDSSRELGPLRASLYIAPT